MRLFHYIAFASFAHALQPNQSPAQHALNFPSQDIITPDSTHSKTPKNYAAVLPSPEAQLKVTSVPYPKCGDDEVIIKNHVAAINPVDWKIQTIFGRNFNLTYPTILGEDVAGEIVEVGSKVKHDFKVGDRVMAYPLGLSNGAAYGGFQLYPLLKAATVAKIPDSLTYKEAAVLPLSISTAAAGLFMRSTLGLDLPPVRHSASVEGKKETLLVWGCSSSVGSSVIQLAHASGYSIITTASPSNYAYCKDLGADEVLDYHDSIVINRLVKLLRGKKIVGAFDAIGSEATIKQNAAVLHALGGGKIASVGATPDTYENVVVARMSASNIVTEEPEIGEHIWGKYVPWALEKGRLETKPKAWVVGRGLEGVQKGLDRQREGVSARKVEVLLG